MNVNYVINQSLSNVNFVVTDDVYGGILRSGNAPLQFVAMQANAGELAFVCGAVNPTTQRVNLDTGEVVQKEPISRIVVGTTISNLPTGSKAIVNGMSFFETNGTISLDSLSVGTHEVCLTHPAFITTYVLITKE
ncbi:hypothetical protein [Methyloversatilis sp.]|uniref:hypothetical protein n=1 Tax=Methyloversatilis sp. TaxID=2569862 RepID=UPI0035B2299A